MTINIIIFATTLKTLPRVLGHHHQPHLSIIIIIIIYYKLLMIFKSAATGLAPEFLGTINNLTTSQVLLHINHIFYRINFQRLSEKKQR